MSLKSTNPTKTNSWNKLRDHFNDIKDIHIDAMFTDDIDRASENQKILVNKKDIIPKIKFVKEKMKLFTASVLSGNHKGFKGDKITDVVNIGIGGSDLGPSMVVESLSHYKTD